LTEAIMGGLLQSLVNAAPSRLGQTCLQGIYDNVHHACPLTGRDLCCTSIVLSDSALADLGWWKDFLQLNPGDPSCSGSAGHLLTVDWGNGSAGTGTGGTSKTLDDFKLLLMETWMGAWATHVHHFSSSWWELQTLVWSLERHCQAERKDMRDGGAVFCCTDNSVTYFVMQNGSSASPELHKLVRAAKLLEPQAAWLLDRGCPCPRAPHDCARN
jgi:hypothetical protein